MSDPPAIRERAKQEAAAWFARLNAREVALTTLEEFRLWRQSPGNRSAYHAIEAQWRAMGALSGSAEVGQAVSEALARGAAKAQARRHRPALGWIAGGALASLLVAVVGGYAIWTYGSIATAVGEQRSVQLADGSTVRLDTDSLVRVRFAGAERHVDLLRGQAFFDVAHDAARPFVVQAGDTFVRAVGTRFDVRRDGDAVQAVLVEGVVQVRRGAATARVWTLQPGQQISMGVAAPQARAVDVQSAVGWTNGHIVFEGVPLSAAVQEVNRYSQRKITLDAPDLADVRVTGVFDSGDVGAFVSAVCALHPLRAEPGADGGVRLVRTGPESPAG
jgi:transmembrane sensor